MIKNIIGQLRLISLGDYSKAKLHLGWKPKINFEELVNEMVLNDYEAEKEMFNIKMK